MSLRVERASLRKIGKKRMKKYLLLIEDEKLWEEFKKGIEKDINSEILELIKERVKMSKGGKK